jgi:protein tyrosine/serine phosphatase
MLRKFHLLLGAIFVALLVAGPYWYMERHRLRSRNFRVVTPDVLYRCGQLDQAGLEKIVHDYGIRTVISLRAHEKIGDHPKHWEETFCRKNGLVFVRIPIQNWKEVEGGTPPAAETVQAFNRVMGNSKEYPHPILLHCFAGLHRTGALTAVYRMEFERWTNDEALGEMERCGYTDIEGDIGGFLRSYVPSWRRDSPKAH